MFFGEGRGRGGGGGGGGGEGENRTVAEKGVGTGQKESLWTGVGTSQKKSLWTGVGTVKKGEIVWIKDAQKISINEPKTEKNTAKNNFGFFDGHFFTIRRKA